MLLILFQRCLTFFNGCVITANTSINGPLTEFLRLSIETSSRRVFYDNTYVTNWSFISNFVSDMCLFIVYRTIVS